MIRINLLPVEKRRKERAPLPRIGLVVLDAAVLVGVVAICAGFVLGILKVNGEINSLTTRKGALQAAVQEHGQLSQTVKERTAQLQEVEKVTGRNIEWWRAIDLVWDVIHRNPRIWIEDVNSLDDKQAAAAVKTYDQDFKGTVPYGISMKCNSAGRDVSGMTKFRRDLKGDVPLKTVFEGINWNVEWTLADEPDFAELYSIPFDIKITGKKAAK